MKVHVSSFALVVCSLLCLAESKSLHGASVKLSDHADLGLVPWQVSIVMDGSNFCSGSIISYTWIISSGSCADGYRAYVITAGSVSSFGGAENSKQLFLTTEAYRHPQFSGMKFYDNDISLIHLQQNIQFSDAVKPIRLPSYSLALNSAKGMQTAVAGWGTTSDAQNGAKIGSTLSYATPSIADDSICREAYGSAFISSKRCFVTSACDFLDQGSSVSIPTPDSYDLILVGIVSGNPVEACANGQPILFTSVPHFLGFIESTTDIAIED